MSQPTQRVGQYNFLKKLGAGRMAEVYLGRIEGAEGFQKPVAIKKILPELATDLQFVQSLIAEAKIGGQLHHRNIVEVYDFIRYGNDYCIIMEYVDGVDLGRILRSARRYRVRIPPAAALYIASQVCDGLDYAHSARGFNGEPLNIIHRDLKPSNILISIKGGVKISDFGIARVMEQALNRTGGSGGRVSYQYQSPELATASVRVTSATDVFSIGVILFEMLTLEPLFPGRNVLEVLEGLREADLARRLSLAQRQLPGSEKILAMALNPNPSERYRTANLMAEDLRRLLVYMKVDDPRERLVTFFARLVRFVQEQSKRPADGQQPEAEDWEADTRSGDENGAAGVGQATLSGVELDASVSAWTPPAEEPVAALANGAPMSAAPEMPMAHGGNSWARPEETAPRPPAPTAYPGIGREDTANLQNWGGAREGETMAGSYATVQAVDEATPIRPVREETRYGTYQTVQQGYEATAAGYPAQAQGGYGATNDYGNAGGYNAPGPYGATANLPPPGPAAVDSTRILSAADIPPPPASAYSPEMTAGDPWGAAANGTQILAVPPTFEPPIPPQTTVKRRSKLPLIAAGVILAVVGGGGFAYWTHSQQQGEVSGAEHRCPTCNNIVPGDAVFCGYCGATLQQGASQQQQQSPDGVKCQNCGEVNEKGAKFCASCGKPL